MADPDGPGHCIGIPLKQAARGIGVSVSDLIVAAEDVYDYEFPVLSGFYERIDFLFVDCSASGWEVGRDEFRRNQAHMVMLTR